MGTLWLLRHAEAAGKPPGGGDADRPLSEQGRAQAEALGAWLRGRGVAPELVLCSTALRARDTLERLSLPSPESHLHEPALYLAAADTLLERIQHAVESRILVVGHNPGIPELAAWLLDPAHLAGLRGGFPPCTLVELGFEGRPTPGAARLSERVSGAGWA